MECNDLLVKAAYLLAATDQELVSRVAHHVDDLPVSTRIKGQSAAGRELMAWLGWHLEADEGEGLTKNRVYTAAVLDGGEHAGLTRTIEFKSRRFFERDKPERPMKGYNINWKMHKAHIDVRPQLWYVCVPIMMVLPGSEVYALGEAKSGSAKNGREYRVAWPEKLLPIEALRWDQEQVREALTARGRPSTLFEVC